MNTAAVIIISLIMLAIVFTIVVIMFVIQDSSDVFMKKRLDQQVNSEPRPASAPVFWSENLRNNKNFENFPPCFDMDASAKNIFGIILRLNLMQRYYNMIDLLSILLCLRFMQDKACRSSDIRDRLVQVKGMGGNAEDRDSQNKASAFIPINDTLQSKMLVATLNLLERQMALMRNDSAVSKQDADAISGHLYSFYVNNFPAIYKKCMDVPSS